MRGELPCEPVGARATASVSFALLLGCRSVPPTDLKLGELIDEEVIDRSLWSDMR